MLTLAEAIGRMEGILVPGSLANRNNNPGNLKYVGQAGATGSDGNGFAIFPSMASGQAALDSQIALDSGRGLTLSQFISKYAPPNENDTSSYLSFVSSQTGIAPGDLLSGGGDYGGSAINQPEDLMTGGFLQDLQAGILDWSNPWIWGSGLALLALIWIKNHD